MKKYTAVLLCAIVLIFLPLGYFKAFAFGQNVLKDINSHWAEESIEELNQLGIMNGYNGMSNPDAVITRGEFTALITRAFELTPTKTVKNFDDINEAHIFYDAIMAASEAGLINGFEDNTFRSEINITREEIMLIVSRLTGDGGTETASFTDIGPYYEYRVQLSKAVNDKIISGYPDGSFRPYNNTTRSEAAKIIVNTMKKYMPQGNTDEVYGFGSAYIYSHFSNIENAEANSLGTALKDLDYIKNTYQLAMKNGYNLSNLPDNVQIMSFSQNGPFSEFLIEYDVQRYLGESIKKYKGQSALKIITRNGQSKVYSHDTRIIVPEFINLTWEVFSGAPANATPGVNYVSPTSFRIETKPENAIMQIGYSETPLYFNSDLTDNYLNYARNNGYKVWVMYKSDFDTRTASVFLNDNTVRELASNILVEQIIKNNLDGVNFDFENMYQWDAGAYTNHVKEITLMAHALGAVVSVDVNKYEPTSSTWSMCYDRDALAKYADYVALMAYDQYYAGGKTPGPVAGLGWTEDCINLTLKEVPADKLVLGMPYYIRIWETKKGKAIGTKAVSMTEAKRQIAENNAEGMYDSRFSLMKYTWTKGESTYTLWLEDAASTAARVRLAKKYNLAGVASWRRGFETEDVWQAIAQEIYP